MSTPSDAATGSAGSSAASVAASGPASTASEPLPSLDSGAVAPGHFKPAYTTWDANVEGGYGRYFPDKSGLGFVRGRAGVLFAHDPAYYALGVTYEWSNQAPWAFGVQAEMLRIETGLWAQAGVLIDSNIKAGATLALGWSIFGVEGQVRSFDPEPYGLAVLGKVRIPISFIAMAFK
ncbi:MAG TPA: hypothetical protein VFQ61_03995 [Polyangiaceae bacterium]|nr:hypothetical protein [Polyangiaceae bacterium]